MALQVWLPLNGDINNQGLASVSITNSSATFNAGGIIGKCLFLNNTGYLMGSPSPLSNNTDSWTFTCWMRPATVHNGCLLSCRNGTATTGITIFYYSSKFLIDDGARWDITPNTTLTANKWYHICVVRKNGVGKYLYINGILDSSTTTTGTQSTVNASYFAIGNSQNAATTVSGNQFNGYLNDIRIYDHALSAREIKEISKGLVLHYPLSRGGFGCDNLIDQLYSGGRTTLSGRTITALISQNQDAYFYFSCPEALTAGQNYTLSLDCSGFTSSDNYLVWGVIAQQGGKNITIKNGHCSATFSPDSDIAADTKIIIDDIDRSHSGLTDLTITNIKLEKGSVATPWIPNSSDSLYSAMGLNSTTEYDVSGYGYNGVRNNITYSPDAPRYNVSYVLNGSNSYIRITSGNWKINGAEAMTISEWAYADNWSNQSSTRLWSCTESGGWNTEAGGTGKLRIPINVYTNADKSSHGYINNGSGNSVAGFVVSGLSSGWHMFTVVYTTSGVTTYIDGVLKDSKSYTSYGLYYHTSNALILGAEAGSGTSPTTPYFNGKLSDFRLYYTALSADDVLELYNTPFTLSNNGTLLTQGVYQEV